MGAGQSGGVEIAGSSMGYQVLRVYPNSPGSRAGLKAYFDFIVAIGNTRFAKEDGSLREILKASVDQKLKMIVFNTRNKMAREIEIVPTTSWGGSGLLGVSIKHSSFDKADERVWHVIEVDPGSPAHQAGFKATEDYVIGSDSILQENDDLYNLIEAHEGKALKLFVYNAKTDNCREVMCHPNSKWGGRGFLGCEFGHGLLHRIPFAESQAPASNPVDLLNSRNVNTQQNNSSSSNNSSIQPASVVSQQFKAEPNVPDRLPQPGNQLFQQALFNQTSTPQQSSQPAENPVLPKPPQAPQTFAQLASAQYQAQMYKQQQSELEKQQQQQQHQQQQQQQQQQQANIQQQQPPAVQTTNSPNQSAPTDKIEGSQINVGANQNINTSEQQQQQQQQFSFQQSNVPSANNSVGGDQSQTYLAAQQVNQQSQNQPTTFANLASQYQLQQQQFMQQDSAQVKYIIAPQQQHNLHYWHMADRQQAQPQPQPQQQQQQQPQSNDITNTAPQSAYQTLPPPPTMYPAPPQHQQQQQSEPPQAPPAQQQASANLMINQM